MTNNPQRRVREKPSAAQEAMEGVVFAGQVAAPAPTVKIEAGEQPIGDGVSTSSEFNDTRNLQQQEASKAARGVEERLNQLYMSQQKGNSKLRVALPPISAEAAAELKPSRYRVVGSEGPVSVDGQRVTFRVGKVLDSNQYRIDYLEQQGVRLQKLDA